MDDINQVKERYDSEIEESAEQLQERLSNMAQQAKARSEEIWEDASDLIREYPAAAMGVALLTGAVVGGLIAGSFSSAPSTGERIKDAADRGSKSLEEAKDGIADTLTSLRCLIDDTLNKLK